MRRLRFFEKNVIAITTIAGIILWDEILNNRRIGQHDTCRNRRLGQYIMGSPHRV